MAQQPIQPPAAQGWAYELLYIPFILPFVVAGCAPLLVFRRELEHSFSEIVHAVLMRIKGPAIALSGALMLVELLRTSDHLKDAPATIIGVGDIEPRLCGSFFSAGCSGLFLFRINDRLEPHLHTSSKGGG